MARKDNKTDERIRKLKKKKKVHICIWNWLLFKRASNRFDIYIYIYVDVRFCQQ